MVNHKHLTQEEVNTATRLFANGSSVTEVSATLGVSIRSALRIYHRVRPQFVGQTWTAYQVSKGGRKRQDQQAKIRQLLEIIRLNPTITPLQIAQQLHMSVTTTCRLMHIANITFKHIIRQPVTHNSEEVKGKRQEYGTWWLLLPFPRSNIYFLDETGFNIQMTEEFGWSVAGSPCVLEVPANRGRNMSLLMVIGLVGIVAWQLYEGSVNADLMSTFVIEKLNPVLPNNSHVVMDNVRFHHSQLVWNSFRNTVQAAFLPPYSPQLNPIEEVFTVVKRQYKKLHVKTKEEARIAIQYILQLMSTENFTQFYKHAEDYVSMGIRREDFPT